MRLPADVVDELRPGSRAYATAMPGEQHGFAGGAQVLLVPTEATDSNQVGQLWAAMRGADLLGWLVPDGSSFQIVPLPGPATPDAVPDVEPMPDTPGLNTLGALSLLAARVNRLSPPPVSALSRALVLAVLHDGQARTMSELLEAAYPGEGIVHELTQVIDAEVSAALRAMVAAGQVREVVVEGDDVDGYKSGDVWFSLPEAVL